MADEEGDAREFDLRGQWWPPGRARIYARFWVGSLRVNLQRVGLWVAIWAFAVVGWYYLSDTRSVWSVLPVFLAGVVAALLAFPYEILPENKRP